MLARRSGSLFGSAVIAVVAAVTLGACSSSGSGGASSGSGGSGSSAAPARVRVELCNGYSASFLPYAVANGDGDIAKIEKQFHTKFVNVSNVTGANCVPSFTSGSVDFFGSTFANDVLAARSKPNVRAILEPFYGSALYLIGSAKHQQDRGSDPAKYDGAHIGATAQGTPTSTYIKVLADQYKFSYKEVDVGLVTAFVPAMQQGRLDAFVGEITSATQALTTKTGYVVTNLNTPQVEKFVGHFGPSANFAAMSDFTSKYPALTQAFVQAQIRALSLIQAAGSDAAKVAALTPPDFPDTHSDKWATEWSLLQTSFQLAPGGISQQAFSDSVQQYLAHGPLKPGAKVAGALVDNSFAVTAYKNLNITPNRQLTSGPLTDAP